MIPILPPHRERTKLPSKIYIHYINNKSLKIWLQTLKEAESARDSVEGGRVPHAVRAGMEAPGAQWQVTTRRSRARACAS